MSIKQFIEDKKFKKQSSSRLFDNDYILVSDLEAFMDGKVVVDDAILTLIDNLPYSKIAEGNSLLCNIEKYNLIVNLLNATQEGE